MNYALRAEKFYAAESVRLRAGTCAEVCRSAAAFAQLFYGKLVLKEKALRAFGC